MGVCVHGMPTPASCLDCMAEGPVAPPPPAPEQLLRAERWITARYDGRCDRKDCVIRAGEPIAIVTDVGWCCEGCAQ